MWAHTFVIGRRPNIDDTGIDISIKAVTLEAAITRMYIDARRGASWQGRELILDIAVGRKFEMRTDSEPREARKTNIQRCIVMQGTDYVAHYLLTCVWTLKWTRRVLFAPS